MVRPHSGMVLEQAGERVLHLLHHSSENLAADL
jgi:hypothetical protein